MATKPTFSQTRDPRKNRYAKDPTRNYILVEQTEVDVYGSMVDEYMTKTNASGDDMYTDHGYQAGICPNKKWTLMSCSQEDYEAHMKAVAEETKARMNSKDKGAVTVEREKKSISLMDMAA